MTEDLLQYDKLVERALKNVVREALGYVSKHGLPGVHHLYITFRTDHPEVEIPDELRERYPSEMTIVLQYQFWDLLVGEDRFEVTLSFNDRHQRLVVPFAAVNAFADPSVNFALQFQPAEAAAQNDDAAAKTDEPDIEAPADDEKESVDNIIPLDTFRKE
ncbi:MAG: ClpXP protease specificity-enhancing factor SspB [Alphaproteobacteria bacterium]|nr:ClpXP protease specificity-enhancing factor SspB [Alphaproteobacteria bacterium]